MKNIYVQLVFTLCLIQLSQSVSVQLYTLAAYKGTVYRCGEVGEGVSCSFVGTAANENTRSAYVTNGTCAVLWEEGPHNGQSLVLSYPNNLLNPDFGSFSNKASVLEQCSRATRVQDCPPDTFVRKFYTLNDQYLSYFSAQCFPPSSTTVPTAILTSHPTTPATPTELACTKGAVRGISVKVGHPILNRVEPTIHTISASCASAGQFKCPTKQALCGFTTKTEQYSDVILGLSARCCEVTDPSLLCIPEDEFVPIITCDNTEALSTTTCRYSDSVGVSTLYTEGTTESVEFNFYAELGFEAGVDGMGLKATFSGKLGASLTTGCEWNKVSTSTWQKQITYEVTMDVPPCMRSVLMQVVGKCTFYEVHATHYKRIDTHCNGTTTQTVGTLEQVTAVLYRP